MSEMLEEKTIQQIEVYTFRDASLVYTWEVSPRLEDVKLFFDAFQNSNFECYEVVFVGRDAEGEVVGAHSKMNW
jgi:hypothetical protein